MPWAVKDKSHKRKLVPIEQKESYKWLESSLNSKETLSLAKEIIIVQDREGDIYEQFCRVPDQRTHLLVRAKSNRTLNKDKKLFDFLSQQDLKGTYQIDLEGDKRRNIKRRTATIEVRFTPVTIHGHQYTPKELPKSVSLYAIEAKEVGADIDNPIHWRLLTTKSVNEL